MAAHSVLNRLTRRLPHLLDRRVRLGVPGLSRAGKTVFTTALIHNLMRATRLPAFQMAFNERLRRARLVPQPDVTIARFPFEEHLQRLARDRAWPESTRQISEIRVEVEYEIPSAWTSPSHLNIDIVDYPGEWLLDLMLINEDFQSWSRKTLEVAARPAHRELARPWIETLQNLKNTDPPDEALAEKLCASFKSVLRDFRSGPETVATTPPGRFLMPGDLEGSPALTFMPLDLDPGEAIQPGSLAALMETRFNNYKAHVVKPFFEHHFRKIDRQIVLVDVLASLNAGPSAVTDLESALDNVMMAFRIGKHGFLSRWFSPRADKVLFVATKADHLHHEQHQRLTDVLRLLVKRAIARSEAAGADVGSLAIASVRATREQTISERGQTLRVVSGVLEAGERFSGKTWDGETESLIFPGELPANPEDIFRGAVLPGSLRFPRFRPPVFATELPLDQLTLPHIRLDAALKFLLGDRFK